MSPLDNFRLLAEYNAWMNARVYDTAAKLAPAELAADRKAFFGSILGTLNHIAVADTIWLRRFCGHPAAPAALAPVRGLPQPTSLDQILFAELPALRARRNELDAVITAMVAALTEADLDQVLEYRSMKGIPGRKRFGGLLQHFFNHQTHHRGQVTTLLTQAGQDVGVTDLLMILPNEP